MAIFGGWGGWMDEGVGLNSFKQVGREFKVC